MKHNHDAIHHSGFWGARLSAKFLAAFVLASAIVIMMGAMNWWLLGVAENEIKAMQLAADSGNAAAMADGLLIRLHKAGWTVIVCVVVGVLFMAGLFFYFARSVIRPLRLNAQLMSRLAVGDGSGDVPVSQLSRKDEIGDLARAVRSAIAYQRREVGLANDISAGDFTRIVPVRDPSDELGLAIQRMASVTLETLRRVNSHVGQVMAGCESIAAAGDELAVNSSGIADAVTEISTSIDQLRTHADSNVGMAEKAGKLATSGSHFVERGYEDIGEMGVVMLNMQACGDKIVRIAKSIGDIAFQTSLLALNASVEAARAGRHGKGFTIVAEEVRNLAVRSSRAAEETSTLMKETVEQVELAAAIAGRINATFAEMQSSIQEADALMTSIITASREQSSGVEQISSVLKQVDQSARGNREYAGTVLEQTDGLVRKANRLRQMMSYFRFDFGRRPEAEPFAGTESAQVEGRRQRAIHHAGTES